MLDLVLGHVDFGQAQGAIVDRGSHRVRLVVTHFNHIRREAFSVYVLSSIALGVLGS